MYELMNEKISQFGLVPVVVLEDEKKEMICRKVIYIKTLHSLSAQEVAIPTSILPLNASCSELNPPESLRRRPETGKCMAIRHIGWHITVMSVYMRVLFAVLTWWRDGA